MSFALRGVDWDRAREQVAAIDEYSPVGFVMRMAHRALAWYEWGLSSKLIPGYLRRKGRDFALEYMRRG